MNIFKSFFSEPATQQWRTVRNISAIVTTGAGICISFASGFGLPAAAILVAKYIVAIGSAVAVTAQATTKTSIEDAAKIVADAKNNIAEIKK